MYMLNGWWFLSSSGSYPPVFMVALVEIDQSKKSFRKQQQYFEICNTYTMMMITMIFWLLDI